MFIYIDRYIIEKANKIMFFENCLNVLAFSVYIQWAKGIIICKQNTK